MRTKRAETGCAKEAKSYALRPPSASATGCQSAESLLTSSTKPGPLSSGIDSDTDRMSYTFSRSMAQNAGPLLHARHQVCSWPSLAIGAVWPSSALLVHVGRLVVTLIASAGASGDWPGMYGSGPVVVIVRCAGRRPGDVASMTVLPAKQERNVMAAWPSRIATGDSWLKWMLRPVENLPWRADDAQRDVRRVAERASALVLHSDDQVRVVQSLRAANHGLADRKVQPRWRAVHRACWRWSVAVGFRHQWYGRLDSRK